MLGFFGTIFKIECIIIYVTYYIILFFKNSVIPIFFIILCMAKNSELFAFRMDQKLRSCIAQAAEKSGLNDSAFVRTTLYKALFAEKFQ